MKNFLKNMFTTGWQGFKYGVGTLWHFMSIEIPELMSNWRLVPRLLMVAYGWAFLDVINWFMALENPTNAQAGFSFSSRWCWCRLVCNLCKINHLK